MIYNEYQNILLAVLSSTHRIHQMVKYCSLRNVRENVIFTNIFANSLPLKVLTNIEDSYVSKLNT